MLEALVEEGLLNKQAAPRPHLPDRYFWLADQYPASGISLRTGTADTIVILSDQPPGGLQTSGRLQSIGQIDRDSGPTLVHEGAIYIHEGQSFIVNRLDWEHGQAFVAPAHVDYYTEASTSTNVDVEEEHERVDAERATTIKSIGEVLITSQTTGFRKIKLVHARDAELGGDSVAGTGDD